MQYTTKNRFVGASNEENHEIGLSTCAEEERRVNDEKIVQFERNSLLTEALNDDKSHRKGSKRVREKKNKLLNAREWMLSSVQNI